MRLVRAAFALAALLVAAPASAQMTGLLFLGGAGGGGAPGPDSIGTSELDDGADVPAAGELVRVAAGATAFEYIAASVLSIDWSQLTGVPATFAPAAHAASHEAGGGDALASLDGAVITAGTVAAARLPAVEGLTTAGAVGTAPVSGGAGTLTMVDVATQAELDAVAGAETDDQVASEVPFTPAGGVVATDVQAAIEEVDAEHTTDTTRTDEEIQDVAGAMVTSNTESGITVTYQDADGTLDFVLDTLGGDATGPLTAIVVGDDSHAHTGSTLSGVDISDDTNLVAGAGLLLTDDTLSTASTEAGFLADGGVTSLVCGAGAGGKMQVLDDGSIEYCDGATTSVLRAGFLDVDGVDDAGTDDQTAVEVPITDVGTFFTGTEVEAALQEVGPTMTDSRAPTAHRDSHETGGSDPLVDLAGETITTGTVADARIAASLSRDTESPAAGDITGSLSAGYQLGADVVGAAELADADLGQVAVSGGVVTVEGLQYGTAFPGTPATGDVFAVTDDSAAGECDSAAGSALSLCRWSGAAWVALGDGGGGGASGFDTITSGTNTTAAMVVGAGASLKKASTGTIDASGIDADGDGSRELAISGVTMTIRPADGDAPGTVDLVAQTMGAPYYSSLSVRSGSINRDAGMAFESQVAGTTQRWRVGSGFGSTSGTNPFRITDLTDGNTEALHILAGTQEVVAKAALTATGTFTASGQAILAQQQVNSPSAQSCVDDTVGASPGALTLTVSGVSKIHLSGLDPDGCVVTVGETGATSGQVLKIIVVANAGGTLDFSDTAGVTELAGVFNMALYDSLTLEYISDRFIESSRSNN